MVRDINPVVAAAKLAPALTLALLWCVLTRPRETLALLRQARRGVVRDALPDVDGGDA